MPAAALDTEILTVTALTRRIKGLLEREIGRVWVSGEISNWRVSPAGHAYFTLKDDQSELSAVMFRGQRERLRFEPDSGLDVLANGEISVYERRGNYQIICRELQPRGVGALQLAFEKLKAKLSAEGLFDESRKKPLPLLPQRIGIVTSPTGAAIRDILNVINRRFANVHILLYPARVQGNEAAPEIAAGIQALEQYGVDVMIVGRGGGSLEDLWAFNEEAVVRAVADADTPIISAVGHEVDFTLCDFAADVRAPTPSAAAELVVKEQQALIEHVARLRQRLARAAQSQVERLRARWAVPASSYVFRKPEELIRQRRQQSDELRLRLEDGMRMRLDEQRNYLKGMRQSLAYLSPSNHVQRAHERLRTSRGRLFRAGPYALERNRTRAAHVMARLDALSPLKILGRGYSLVRDAKKERLIRAARELKAGDTVHLTFHEGEASATIEEIKEADHG